MISRRKIDTSTTPISEWELSTVLIIIVIIFIDDTKNKQQKN